MSPVGPWTAAVNEAQAAAEAYAQACSTGGTGFADAEVPAGTIDGANLVFTLRYAPNPQQSLMLFGNGIKLRAGDDYTLDGSAITFTLAPKVGASLEAHYRY